jgi:sulfatase modifying factor 1
MGGMGAVYYAVHPRLNVEVAVKILPPHLADQDPSLVDRFLAEGRIAAALASDHVVRVLDVDREGSTSFLVMEYVKGESAGECLQRRRLERVQGLPENDALEIVIAATRGLAAAHAHGIVHRDIKPDNILIPQGALSKSKLADLGLAKPQSGQASHGTRSDVAMGTPGYMAPEQIEDTRSAGPAADVFSMGATLYTLIAGSAPFSGASLVAILRDTASKDPDRLPAAVSAATRSLVSRCLSKDPSKRFANGMELLQALEGIRGGPGSELPPESARSTKLLLSPIAAGTSRSRRWRWGAGAALLLAGIAGFWTLREKGQRPADPAATMTLGLGDGVRMEMVYIKPGTFAMGGTEAPRGDWQGDERPQHPVVLTKGYFIGKYEVTRRQFAAFVQATGYRTDAERDGSAWGRVADRWTSIEGLSWQNPNFTQTDDHPVTCVTWNDSKAFCDWLAAKTNRDVCLPTEAEWENACRAGTTTRWSCGDDEATVGDYGWTSANSGFQTHPVGQKKPNAWGLYDMHGNVWEWCQDWVGPYTGEARDPEGPHSGDRRCLRGGGWDGGADASRSAFRCRDAPNTRHTLHGFRVCLH